MKIYILTLPDAEERRRPLCLELDRLGIQYELWQGIDGRNGLPLEFEKLIDRVNAKINMKREMGNLHARYPTTLYTATSSLRAIGVQ